MCRLGNIFPMQVVHKLSCDLLIHLHRCGDSGVRDGSFGQPKVDVDHHWLLRDHPVFHKGLPGDLLSLAVDADGLQVLE